MKKRLLSKQVSQLLIAGLSSLAFTHTAYAVDGFLSNPNWEIQLTSAGYSDYLGDHTPGFLGREYLSGEWGAAVGYTKAGTTVNPIWLERNFIYPDWTTNSDFDTTTAINGSDTFATSVISNLDLRITQNFQIVDTLTGTPMGITAASAAGAGTSLLSNRYALLQSYSITNINEVDSISNLQFFQFLHGLESQSGVYDNRSYVGAYSDYRYDVTLGGDGGAAGQFDYIGFSSKIAPSAFEIGYYGVEGVDDHYSTGKPTVGTHLSIENNDLQNTDSFAPTIRWVSGAERWDLLDLAAGETKTFDVLLTILTGWQVASGDAGGSGNGGSTQAGGVDYEFEGTHTDGQFFISYHPEDEAGLQALINTGEIGIPPFETTNGPTQLFDVDFQGEFQGLLKLTFGYDVALLGGVEETLLRVFHWRDGRSIWEDLGGTVDTNNHTITVYTDSLSPFAVASVAAVPVPGAIWLFSSGLIGLIGIRKSLDSKSKVTIAG
jgi:hypothetical protein